MSRERQTRGKSYTSSRPVGIRRWFDLYGVIGVPCFFCSVDEGAISLVGLFIEVFIPWPCSSGATVGAISSLPPGAAAISIRLRAVPIVYRLRQ